MDNYELKNSREKIKAHALIKTEMLFTIGFYLNDVDLDPSEQLKKIENVEKESTDNGDLYIAIMGKEKYLNNSSIDFFTFRFAVDISIDEIADIERFKKNASISILCDGREKKFDLKDVTVEEFANNAIITKNIEIIKS